MAQDNPDDSIQDVPTGGLLVQAVKEPIPGECILRSKIHINALPVELLGEVFICYMDRAISVNQRYPRTVLFGQHHTGGLTSSPGRPHSPALLGCVCSHWRRMTLSMPILWKDVCTAKPTAPDSSSLFNLWLKRSGSCPLNISILHTIPFNTVAPLNSLERPPLDAISQSHRLKALRMDLDQNLEQALSRLPPCEFPLLEEFSVELVRWSNEGSLRLFEWVSSGAPNLREVTFCARCTRAVLSVNMHWEQLTRIILFPSVQWTDLHRVLALCARSLQHLTLVSVRCSSSPAPTDVLSLPSLQSLELFRRVDFPHVIYNALRTPSLVQLYLQPEICHHPPDALSPLFCFLERSNCHLQSLIWFGSRPESDGTMLPELLVHPLMHKLVHLNVLTRVTDRVLQALTHTSGLDPKPLPSLRTIVLDACESTDGVLSAMVLSRVKDSSTNKLELVRAVLYADWRVRGATFTEDMSLKSKVPGIIADISCA